MSGGDPAGLAAEVNDAVFETWGRDAVYSHEASGVSIDCVVVEDNGDRVISTGGRVSAPVMQGRIFRLRASEVPAPQKAAIITQADGTRFKIISQPKAEDSEHSVFRFSVERDDR